MKPLKRNILIVLSTLVLLVMFMIGYLTLYLPDVGPAPDIQVELTPEKIERGAYLANHVMLCMDCHAVRDFTVFAGPPVPGTEGAGGEIFDQNIGLPGSFVSRNITPAALGDWTDGEIFRAITSGVSRDGKSLFPIMPYPQYAGLDERDIRAVIAYLRSLPPVENVLPSSKADFPVSLLMNTMPVKPEFSPIPTVDDRVRYGKYLTRAAACTDCHTRIERGAFVGEPFAGGNEYILPDGSVVRSANITPHATGIGNWTEEQFVSRFRAYADSQYVPYQVESGQFQTIMPWLMYGGMTEDDLGAIYSYLMSLPAVEKQIELFTPGELISKESR